MGPSVGLPSRPVEVPALQRALITAAFFKDQTLCDPVCRPRKKAAMIERLSESNG